MKPTELAVLLPCHSLEDFPLHYVREQAEGLLAAWTALWHPALIAAADRVPTWYRADDPPSGVAGKLLVIPAVSDPLLLGGWAARTSDEGACVVRRMTRPAQIFEAAVAGFSDELAACEPELVAEFHALGYGYLLVELLSRRMRYTSSIDEVALHRQTLAAARATASGQADEAREHLSAAFDTIFEARERFYPVDTYLIDLTLVAPSTLGAELACELCSEQPINLLLSGRTLEEWSERDPESLARLRESIQAGRACVVGGAYDEVETALLSPEDELAQLERGMQVYERLLGARPTVYGRRRYGLAPWMPQLLSRFGFDGALHFTLDDGQFAKDEQGKVQWEGLDGSTIPAVARVPLDASQPGTFLNLPEPLGSTMDMDQVATLVMAHWPGHASSWYADFRRIAAHGGALGRFATVDDYFRSTDAPGYLSRFDADRYRAPYLRQDTEAGRENAISRIAAAHQARVGQTAREALRAMTAAASGNVPGTNDSWHDSATATMRCVEALAGSRDAAHRGCLVLNPSLRERQEVVQLPGQASANGSRNLTLVEVPPLGFAWADSPAPPVVAKRRRARRTEFATLENEHLLVSFDAETGGIRGVHDKRHRGNLLSQQIALREQANGRVARGAWRNSDETAVYSTMIADSTQLRDEDSLAGQFASQGRLVDASGQTLCAFSQTVRLPQTSRTIEIECTLSPEKLPTGDPWENYYALRFAWSDPAADLHRSVGWSRRHTSARRIEAPYFVEVHSDPRRVAILAGGLPYHRRVDMRMLDSLLIVDGETAREFRVGIAVGRAHAAAAAFDWMSPLRTVPDIPRPAAPSGWLFHLGAPNVIATYWEPLVESGRVTGFRTRLAETDGRYTQTKLRCCQPIARARQVDFSGRTLADLRHADEAIKIDFTAHEWVEVEAHFAASSGLQSAEAQA